jgi:hypothetical protein
MAFAEFHVEHFSILFYWIPICLWTTTVQKNPHSRLSKKWKDQVGSDRGGAIFS